MKKWYMMCLAASAMALTAQENILKNGDFEKVKNGIFESWGYNRKIDKYHFVDSEVKHSGQYSLRFENVDTYDAFTNAGSPIANLKEDLLLRGWVKYENLSTANIDGKSHLLPFIGIWTNNANGTNNVNFSGLKLAAGSRDWFYFEKLFSAAAIQDVIARKPHDQRPASWSLRINIANQPGKIWFDDLELIRIPKDTFTAKLNATEFTADTAKAQLEINAAANSGSVTLAITDANQKKVQEKTIPVTGTLIKTEVDLTALAPGRYKLTLTPSGFEAKPVTIDFGKSAGIFDE